MNPVPQTVGDYNYIRAHEGFLPQVSIVEVERRPNGGWQSLKSQDFIPGRHFKIIHCNHRENHVHPNERSDWNQLHGIISKLHKCITTFEAELRKPQNLNNPELIAALAHELGEDKVLLHEAETLHAIAIRKEHG